MLTNPQKNAQRTFPQYLAHHLPEIMAVKFSPQLTCDTLNGSLSNDGDTDSDTDTPRPSWPSLPWPNAYNSPFSADQVENSISFISGDLTTNDVMWSFKTAEPILRLRPLLHKYYSCIMLCFSCILHNFSFVYFQCTWTKIDTLSVV